MFSLQKIITKCTSTYTLTQRFASMSVSGGPLSIITDENRIIFDNPRNTILYKNLTRSEVKDFIWPVIKFHYTKEDVAQHAVSSGIKPETPYAQNYLNPNSPKFQALPSFPFPLLNKIFVDISFSSNNWMVYDKMLHGGHYIEYPNFKEFPTEGILNIHWKISDVLDKGSGTLYCFKIQGTDEKNDKLIFNSEYQLFEVKTGGFNGPRDPTTPMKSILPVNPNKDHLGATLEFQTVGLSGQYSDDPSPDELKMDIYLANHPYQHYSSKSGFTSEIIVHGRSYFAGALHTIIGHYAQGDSSKFKAAIVRYAKPVFPGDKIIIKTWIPSEPEHKNKIKFEGFVERNLFAEPDVIMTGGYIEFI